MDLNDYQNQLDANSDYGEILAILDSTLRGFAFAQNICLTALREGYSADWVEEQLRDASSYMEEEK